MTFKPIPDESASNAALGFTTRTIRRAGEADLIQHTQKLLLQFADEGGEMLVSDMQDLVECLHRTALLAQRTKQQVLISRLDKISAEKREKERKTKGKGM